MSIRSVHFILWLYFCSVNVYVEGSDVTVITSAKSNTDVFQRFIRSSKIYNLDVKVIDQEKTMACDMEDSYCRRDNIGESVLLPMRRILQELKQNESKIVIIINSPNTIFNLGEKWILKKFNRFESQVVFSADNICHPDESLKSKYPRIKQGKAYLSSAGFMGYASAIYNIIYDNLEKYSGNDQLFFTQLYLDEKIRKKYDIKVDHMSRLFQTLNEEGEFDIIYQRNSAYLKNMASNSTPGIILGSDSNPWLIDMAGDYIARSYSLQGQCIQCRENTIDLNRIEEKNFPTVLIGILISRPTPFFEEFLYCFNQLDYPKNKLHLFIHLGDKHNQKELEEYMNTYRKYYLSVKYDGLREHIQGWEAKTEAVRLCARRKCDYYMNLDSTSLMSNPQTLRLLIEQNRSVVAPILTNPFSPKNKINIKRYGQEKSGFDYNDIESQKKRGLWTASYISSAYLINGTLLQSKHKLPNFYSPDLDADMAFSKHMRKNNVLLYASNRVAVGYLVFSEHFNRSRIHNEIYDIKSNLAPWQSRYINQDHYKIINSIIQPQQPCPEVYLFPMFTPRFCSQLLDIIIRFGKWSDATLEENRQRLSKSELVCADNVLLSEIGFDENWHNGFGNILKTMRDKLFPMYRDEREFPGPYVSRFNPSRMAKSDPHFDTSLYTINVALNRQGIDYQGGGDHFFKDNCSVTDMEVGWMLMYKGDNAHEGLETTKGTRYILGSFQSREEEQCSKSSLQVHEG